MRHRHLVSTGHVSVLLPSAPQGILRFLPALRGPVMEFFSAIYERLQYVPTLNFQWDAQSMQEPGSLREEKWSQWEHDPAGHAGRWCKVEKIPHAATVPIFKENMLKLQRPVLPLVYKADLAHSPLWQGSGRLSCLWRSFSAPSPPPARVRLQHTPSPPKWHTETPRSHRLMRIPQHTDGLLILLPCPQKSSFHLCQRYRHSPGQDQRERAAQ